MARIRKLVQEVRALIEVKVGRSAATMVENDKGEILLLQRGSTAPWMPNKWSLPGGSVDEGETPEQGAKREAKEEAGITLRTLKLFWKGPIPGLPNEDLYIFHATSFSGEAHLTDYENTALKWVDKATAYQEDLVPPLPMILKKLAPK